MKCQGLLGFLFGHNLKAIYDEEKEYYSVEEKQKIMISEFWNSIDLREGTHSNEPKRITKLYKGSICKRCGHKINDETLKF